MRRISVKEAQPGMVLARPITDQQGRTIVNKGASLTQLYISRLGKWGIEELFVEGPQAKEAAAGPAAPAQEPAVPEGKPPARAEPQPPPEPEAARVPPGVYSGPDLDERVVRTFSGVIDDPLMTVLCSVVRKRLAEAAGGGE